MMSSPLFDLPAAFLAQAASDAQADGPPAYTMIVYIVLFLAIMYFVMIRPQQVMKKKQDELISQAKSGDRVTTSGGIIGVVANVRENTFLIRVAENVKIEVLKSAVSAVEKGDAKKAAAADNDVEDEAGDSDEEAETVAADGTKSAVPRNRSKKKRR